MGAVTIPMPRPRVAIVDGHKKEEFFAPLRAVWDADWLNCVPPMLLAGETDGAELILVNDESWPDVAAALPELERRGIPSLHLPDGIVEWRNQWERPGHGPLFQPVLSTRIACLGPAQARLFSQWGNAPRCIVTGAPRFDQFRDLPKRTTPHHGPLRLLVATARTPAHSNRELTALLQLLKVVQEWAATQPDIQISWRLTANLDQQLRVQSNPGTLMNQLAGADAVWTSPSTLQLEAMLAGLPVALLDPFACPLYVPAAWYIRSAHDCPFVLDSMRRADPARWQYQRETLADQVAFDEPAAPKVARAGQDLIDAARTGAGFFEGSPPHLLPLTDAEHQRLLAEIQALRRVAGRTVGQTLYRLLTDLDRRLSRNP